MEQMNCLLPLDDGVLGAHLERRKSASLSFQQGRPEARSQGRSVAGTLAASIEPKYQVLLTFKPVDT